jgi:ABC-2 type transport system ATP-binding protein
MTQQQAQTEVERPSTPTTIVEVSGASRSFGDFSALSNVSLSIEPGQVFGLVGPSGSGKTTLVRMILGVLQASEGNVMLWGAQSEDLGPAEKRRVGYMPQEFSLYPSLTVLENARFMAGIYGVGWLLRRKRIREILTFLDIWDARNRLAQNLSGGMRRRLALACALLHNPDFLVVDEPTAGLDPDLRQRIWELLRGISDRGITILMTTQYLEEAERCDAVAILNRGRLAASGTPDELRTSANLPDIIEVEADGLTSQVVQGLLYIDGVLGLEWDRATQMEIRCRDNTTVQVEINSTLTASGCSVNRIQGRSATFEDVFTSLVRREPVEA